MSKPIIIIGAPRSGTNILRDTLTGIPGIGTWPCDEINYIWRHGNIDHASDEFTPELATPQVVAYLRRQFDRFAEPRQLDYLVEKTCANSLRVGFVDKVFPDAKYLYIVRDGFDVTGSAMLRWTASLDLGYVMRKARYVPLIDLPYYASRYFYHRIYKLFSSEKRLASWGPVLDDMDAITAQRDIHEVCAIQWARCVDNADRDFSRIDEARIHRIKYEDFVSQPMMVMDGVMKFIGHDVSRDQLEQLSRQISAGSVGKGRSQLGPERVERILPLIQATLARHGYL